MRVQGSGFRVRGSGFRKPRRGVSLMEVLISIFVLSIGLMGVAALIPIAAVTVGETSTLDRAAACGRAALRDVQVRMNPFDGKLPTAEAFDPQNWLDAQGNYYCLTQAGQAREPFTALDTVVIDPLGVAAGRNAALGGMVPRLTLRAAAQYPEWAEYVMTGSDDLTFDIPDDAGFRTRGLFYQADPVTKPGAAMDVTPTAWPVTAGDYTWLVTAAPSTAELSVSPLARSTFKVSVAVCYKRAVQQADSERWVAVNSFYGGGLGGGGVRLAEPLRAKQNEWVLLCGRQPAGQNLFSGQQLPPRVVCEWYRVISATDTPFSMLTLAGPDWDANNIKDTQVVKIDSVVGVYTTTIQFGQNRQWLETPW